MKKFLFLLLAVTAGTAPAQTLVYPGEHEMPPVPKTFDNELGVRYGAQLYVGDGRGPELLSLIHISEPTRPLNSSRMPSSA